MRYLLVIMFILCAISGISHAHPSDVQETDSSPFIHNIWKQHIRTSSLQLAIYSYKPGLGDLNNVLQNIGISNPPVAMMPTLSLVLQHIPELDSRLEIGYWSAELQSPGQNPLSITATLVPISYQLIYRPVFLYQYLPIYFGAGIGILRANFSGNMVDLLEQQGFGISNSGSSTTGYVFTGIELFQWKSNSGTHASIGNNATIMIEFKRILKTIETTGTLPLNITLDGTAIGLGVKTQF